jgi:hypothetical protein
MIQSAEADVLHAAIEGDYAEVLNLLNNAAVWSREGMWRFHRQCQELADFLHGEVMSRPEVAP